MWTGEPLTVHSVSVMQKIKYILVIAHDDERNGYAGQQVVRTDVDIFAPLLVGSARMLRKLEQTSRFLICEIPRPADKIASHNEIKRSRAPTQLPNDNLRSAPTSARTFDWQAAKHGTIPFTIHEKNKHAKERQCT